MTEQLSTTTRKRGILRANRNPERVNDAVPASLGDGGSGWFRLVQAFGSPDHGAIARSIAWFESNSRAVNGDLVLDGNGELILAHTETRWVGNGRVIRNNKGLPIKQYEPFFSSTDAYETEADLVEMGVTPLLHYDPFGRLLRTDLPDGTLARVEFTPWRQVSFDPGDTVLQSAWHARESTLTP